MVTNTTAPVQRAKWPKHCNIPSSTIAHYQHRWSGPSPVDYGPRLWPYDPVLWPTPSLRLVLRCGALHLPKQENPQTGDPSHPYKGAKRLLQILVLSESAHLIGKLCCERVTHEHQHSVSEIQVRWFRVINTWLTDNKSTPFTSNAMKPTPC